VEWEEEVKEEGGVSSAWDKRKGGKGVVRWLEAGAEEGNMLEREEESHGVSAEALFPDDPGSHSAPRENHARESS